MVLVLVLSGSGRSCSMKLLCHRSQSPVPVLEGTCRSCPAAHWPPPSAEGHCCLWLPSPPAQGASSLSGHPAATSRDCFWQLSKLMQCPRGKLAVPSSNPADFHPGESNTAPLTRGRNGSVCSFSSFVFSPGVCQGSRAVSLS